MSGRIIVVEGIDGSGKATQTKKICSYLQQRGIPFQSYAFPDYAQPSSVPLQLYLQGKIAPKEQVNAYAASSFFAVDRYISFKTNWEPDYLSGKVIVCDRYVTSNLVHQMTKLPEQEWDSFISWLNDYEYEKLGLPKPDFVLYLDMYPKISRQLMMQRYGGDTSKLDVHEADFQYLTACRRAALYAAQKLGWHIIRCCDDHMPFTVEKVFHQIQDVLDRPVSQWRNYDRF